MKIRKKMGILSILIGLGMILYTLSCYLKVETITKQPFLAKDSHVVFSPTQFLKEGEKMGVILMPKLEKTISIYEGVSAEVLTKGAGHYPKSALPGENNNVVLSGHRDTFFRFLRDLKKNDSLIIQTMEKEYEYKITKFSIVSPNDRTILTPKSRAVLTLTTCYPFSFIGHAPKRYVVTAALIHSEELGKNNRSE
ncbi:class D sortase [Niallia circulans]|uniref:class D sortase n=1 Tax=Niallia circulans TaxID=1397 RepID=UPI00397B5A7F